eukprot:698340-Rhodomonas_salina.3
MRVLSGAVRARTAAGAEARACPTGLAAHLRAAMRQTWARVRATACSRLSVSSAARAETQTARSRPRSTPLAAYARGTRCLVLVYAYGGTRRYCRRSSPPFQPPLTQYCCRFSLEVVALVMLCYPRLVGPVRASFEIKVETYVQPWMGTALRR